MKKKIIVALSAIALPFMIGYLFALGLLVGFLASKYLAGKSAGEKGKLGSIVIPLMGLRIHLHHWLYSMWLIGISFVTGVHFLSPIITYGFLGGLAFQGIYSYGDWHVILLRRSKTTNRGHQPAAGSKKPTRSQKATKIS